MREGDNTCQILVVQRKKAAVWVSFYERERAGDWALVFRTQGFAGKNGFGKEREGDGKTPTGLLRFGRAFGIMEDPGTELSYTKVDDTHYWVSDPDSFYYNQLISTRVTAEGFEREKSEHLTDYQDLYRYGLEIQYNPGCIKGKGSAIFLHCSKGKHTGGCVAIPEKYMVILLRRLREGAKIFIKG